MYSAFREWCERLLRIPHEPAPPPGDEASARVFRAAPAFLKYQIVLWFIGVTAMLVFGVGILVAANVAAFASTSHTRGGAVAQGIVLIISAFVLLLLIAHALFSFAVLRLNYEKRWYVVTDRSLRIREGVVTVREMTVTFANIQNLSVMQGPIQRALGIADLQVETAGGGSSRGNEKQLGPNLHTAWFRGIDNAEEVKQLIQQRLRALKDSGLGDHEESRAAHSAPAAPAFLEALCAVHAEASALRAAVAQR
jgi:membrane protein YdbS with pleckstrin-like domain